MGLPQQFLAPVAADAAERVVGLDDPARAIGDRDDRLHVDGAQQRIVVAQRGFEPGLRPVPFGHVAADFHEPGKLALGVVQRLDLGVDPVLAAVLGAVEDFDPARGAGGGRVGQRLQHRRLGLAAAQQLAGGLAQRVVERITADAGEALVDPVDAQIAVGDRDRIRGSLDHLGEPVKVDRHPAGQSFGAAQAGGLLAQKAREQGAGQGAGNEQQPGWRAVERRIELRRAANAQRDIAARQRHAALGLEAAGMGRGGGTARLHGGVGDGVEHEPVRCRAIFRVDQLEVHLTGGHVGNAIEQLAGHDGRVQQAHERRPALDERQGVAAVAIYRHVHQESRAVAFVLHHGDRPAEGGLAGLDGLLRRAPPHRFRAHVEPAGAEVASRRLDVLDDVQIVVAQRLQLAHRELRFTIRALAGHKGVDSVARHPLDEAEPAHAGKFARQVARLDISAKLGAIHLAARCVNTPGAVHPVERLAKTARDFISHPLRAAFEFALGMGFDVVPQPESGRRGDARSQHEQRRGQEGARKPGSAWRAWGHDACLAAERPPDRKSPGPRCGEILAGPRTGGLAMWPVIAALMVGATGPIRSSSRPRPATRRAGCFHDPVRIRRRSRQPEPRGAASRGPRDFVPTCRAGDGPCGSGDGKLAPVTEHKALHRPPKTRLARHGGRARRRRYWRKALTGVNDSSGASSCGRWPTPASGTRVMSDTAFR